MKWLLLILCMCAQGQATEFLYPVAVYGQDYLLAIYQKTPHHIELWQWDMHTKQADNILLSRYTPAGLQLLPNNVGYSFIDNGRIRIKKWAKRSPRNVELDGPVGHIELIHWIDEHRCYTSGMHQDRFDVFQIDDEGTVLPLVVDSAMDCMYPQKINDTLFFIMRDKYRQYSIVSVPYKAQGAGQDEFYDRIHSYTAPEIKTILEGGLRPIIFLHMISLTEGFYMAHPRAISKKDQHIGFTYHHLSKQDGIWQSKQLLSFTIPTSLLFTGKKSRLYEALLPLVPRYYRGDLFYSDSGETDYLSIYRYCVKNGHRRQISPHLAESHFFAPVFEHDTVYFGGTLCDSCIDLSGSIRMDIVDGYIRMLLGFSLVR